MTNLVGQTKVISNSTGDIQHNVSANSSSEGGVIMEKKYALSTLSLKSRKELWYRRMQKLAVMPTDQIRSKLINRWIKECGGMV